jgi:hypothetical protein
VTDHLPEPEAGMVVRFDYQWADRRQPRKDRPACVVFVKLRVRPSVALGRASLSEGGHLSSDKHQASARRAARGENPAPGEAASRYSGRLLDRHLGMQYSVLAE